MDESGQRECARGGWCSARTVTFEDGERIVTPALTYRPYCDSCQAAIAVVLAGTREEPRRGLAALYRRLSAAIGDPLQADVWVPSPFGPVLPLREDIDAHMRLLADITAGWAARVRFTARLSAPEGAHGSPERVTSDCATLGTHAGVLLALQPDQMRRDFRLPLADDTAELLADCEILRGDGDSLTVFARVGGEDAGREILHLDYLGRRLLLETNPPPEILISPCRSCTRRGLRRAWPSPGDERDLYSRCDWCRDEMTQAEYDVNLTRWVAYHRANRDNRPVLGEPAAA